MEEDILHLRENLAKEMEKICEKYANITEEGEGYLLEEIDQFYNSNSTSVEEQEPVKSLEEQEVKSVGEQVKLVEQDEVSSEQQVVEHGPPKQQQPSIHRVYISKERITKLPKDILVTSRHDRTHKTIKIRRSRSGTHTTRHYSTRHHPYYHTIVQHLYTPVYASISPIYTSTSHTHNL